MANMVQLDDQYTQQIPLAQSLCAWVEHWSVLRMFVCTCNKVCLIPFLIPFLAGLRITEKGSVRTAQKVDTNACQGI
jgi:hypothetical protein